MSKLVSVYRKLSYRKKVFAGMIISALIPILICFVGVLISFRLTNEAKLKRQALSIVSQTQAAISETCDFVKESLHKISFAPATLRMLKDNDDTALTDTYRLMYSSSMGNLRYADYALYDSTGKLKLYSGDQTFMKKKLSVNWGILYELSKDASKVSVRGGRIYSGSNKEVFLRMGQAVADKEGNVYGYIIAQINERNFTDMLAGIVPAGSGSLYIYDNFDEVVFSLGNSGNPQEDDEGIKEYKEAAYENLSIVYRQQTEPYDIMNKSLLLYLSLAALAGLIISLLTSQNLSSMFYRPIRRMSEGMEKIKQGDFEAKVKVDSEDELGHLSEMFNDMSSKLTDNMNKLVNREKELSDANIKMMQAQLNPHFIYNTLDTMKWIGKDNEVPEVATLSSGLAAIMRASISSGQTVSLQKEIDLMENYTAIQQIRFDDKFIFLTDIPKELLDCEVPKLILQPIVENAIIHGLEGRDYGQVLVSGYKDGENLILSVKDDGIGVSDEAMEKLNNHEQLAKGSNIGFHNVDSIIRLHYGEEYGLHIERCENGGTEVVYRLPYIKVIA